VVGWVRGWMDGCVVRVGFHGGSKATHTHGHAHHTLTHLPRWDGGSPLSLLSAPTNTPNNPTTNQPTPRAARSHSAHGVAPCSLGPPAASIPADRTHVRTHARTHARTHHAQSSTHLERRSHDLHEVVWLLLAVNDQLTLEEPVAAVCACACVCVCACVRVEQAASA
jgi:hypothetical protein